MSKPIIALMYDFDKTLCTKDMQEYSFIAKIGMSSSDFWNATTALAEERKMDRILAYMYMMLKKASAVDQRILRNDFVEHGRDLEFFPGVEEWFERMNAFANTLQATVEHYIISSGLREIIEGSSVFKHFREVFACEFLYDVNGAACWPKNAVNYTTKTQFLFRINKGVLDLCDDDALNRFTPEDDRAIPFRNMIYIGDGFTDVPCMRLVKSNDGYSIAVYKPGERKKVEDLILHERVDYIAEADYSKEGELDKVVQEVIKKMVITDGLKCKNKALIRHVEAQEM